MREVVLNPEPEMSAVASLPVSARIEMGKVTSDSNAANPISFDVKSAVLSYAQKRGTFREILDGPADLTLKISAGFVFSSGTTFNYTFRLHGVLMAAGRPLGQYTAEATAHGGMTRFTAAADRAPTNEALTLALDKLFLQIEADRERVLAQLGAGTSAPVVAAPAAPVPVSEVDTPRYKLEEKAENFALVIGIEKYQNLPPADFAEHDAAAVRRHLLSLGYPERNIIFLTGPKAGRTGIEKYLQTWLPLNVKSVSRVFVYFSGHGAPDPATGQAYLVPWDGDAKFLKDTAYPVKRLYENLNALKAERVLLAMDACFSGEGGRSVLAKGARPLVTKVDTGISSGGKLVVFAASGPDEITGTQESEGHGLFTYHFLKALGDKNGSATVRELYNALLPKVQDAARRDGREQTPQLLPAELGGKDSSGLR